MDLSKAQLWSADFSKARLRRASLNNANLFSAKLIEADLEEATLVQAKLTMADFFRAKLSHANLYEAELLLARLIEATAVETDFARSFLAGADLSRVNAPGAIMKKTNLSGADLDGANLRRVGQSLAFWHFLLPYYSLPFILDNTSIRGVRFAAFVQDPWSVLRRKYTGSNLLFIVLFSLAALLPLLGQMFFWVGVGKAEGRVIAAVITAVRRTADLVQQLPDPAWGPWVERADRVLKDLEPWLALYRRTGAMCPSARNTSRTYESCSGMGRRQSERSKPGRACWRTNSPRRSKPTTSSHKPCSWCSSSPPGRRRWYVSAGFGSWCSGPMLDSFRPL